MKETLAFTLGCALTGLIMSWDVPKPISATLEEPNCYDLTGENYALVFSTMQVVHTLSPTMNTTMTGDDTGARQEAQ